MENETCSEITTLQENYENISKITILQENHGNILNINFTKKQFVDRGSNNNDVNRAAPGQEHYADNLSKQDKNEYTSGNIVLQNGKEIHFHVSNDVVESGDSVNKSSEDLENVSVVTKEILMEDVEHTIQKTNKFRKNKYKIVDSDSEEENLPLGILNYSENENLSETYIKKNKKNFNRLAIVDSESDAENEDEIMPHNKSFSDNGLTRQEDVIFTTDSKGNLVPEKSNICLETTQKSRLSALCDSDSDENNDNKEEEYNLDEKIEVKPRKKIQKQNKNREEKPKKMTGMEAAKLRAEIKSESQRMVREKNISLPYHKPKSYTLKEFLARRPKLAAAVPHEASTPPSVAIKMSAEQLEVISKKLQEREEEVKQFYKSESEPEDDEDDKDYIPPDEEKKKEACKENDSVSKTPNLETASAFDQNNSNECETSTQVDGHLQDHLSQNKSVEEEVEESVSTNENPIEIYDETNKQRSIEKITDFNNSNEISEGNRIIPSNSALSISEVETNDNLCKEQLAETVTIEETITSDTIVNPVTENNTVSINSEVNLEKEHCSMDYDFNLDDLEENSERLLTEKITGENSKKQNSGFEYTDLDREIENFGVSNESGEKSVDTFTEVKKLSKLEFIKEKFANIKPKLSGCPDNVIDLETGVTKPNEVSKLMERFAKHTSKKQTHKNKVKLSIVSVESGEIHKETVAMNIEEDDSSVIEEKPGVRLQKLRNDLQNQMAQMRSELWNKKATHNLDDRETDPYEGEKGKCGEDDDILDDEEEEAEITESSEDEEIYEEDLEEDAQKGKVKSVFIEQEAEETDEEDDEAVEDELMNEDIIEDIEGEDINTVSETKSNVEENTFDVVEEQSHKKPLRRILKGFIEDSDDDDDELDLTSQISSSTKHVNENLNKISQDDDDFLPPHQPQSSQTPLKHINQTQSKPDFEFLTPISYITGLQNLNNSVTKSKETPPKSSFQTGNVPSPLKENNWQHSLQKKLFTDAEITDSQLEEVAGLCSVKFSENKVGDETDSVSEEELANMCSGTFPLTLTEKDNDVTSVGSHTEKMPSTIESQKEILTADESPSTQDLLNICSGGFTGITQTDSVEKFNVKSNTETYKLNTNEEIKSLDEDQGLIISQLIDEEEMENFKRKFDSPLLSNTQRRIVEEFEEVAGSGHVIDSDDEDDTLEIKKRRNQKKLMFSDDENSDDDQGDEEVIDLHDNIDDDASEDVVSNVDNIEYDSEENEIELTEESDAPKRLKPSDFFENEAELSESDWDSADEDEKDLDTLEFEQGDTEKFDEKKIRSDLEKIHMRRMLDDDTREVKLLQELLLEDGELHGTGRQRQFRWKNIDSTDEGAEEKKEEDNIFIDEEESEEQWRKKRHEREMFLKEKFKKSQSLENDDDLLSKSQLLQIGHKVIQRSQSQSQGNTPVEKPKCDPDSPVAKQPFTLLNKRGSFLRRSDEVLQRLAGYNKMTTVTLGAAKNSKSFLFQSIEETSVSIEQDKKRKATDGTPNAIKKLRLSDSLSPASKPEKSKRTRTKLFGIW